MEILAYISAVFIGIVLGLLGGGGSILTVPILVYLLAIPAYEATAYSLFIVGVTSLTGSINYMRYKLVDFKIALLFSIPSFIGVLLTRKLLLPNLPDLLFTLGDFEVSKNLAIMVLFSLLMMMASYSMIKKNNIDIDEKAENKFRLIIKFFFVGVLLGLVGAGGGFLIIPSLIFFAKLDMKTAVGTSLLIISANTSFCKLTNSSLITLWNSFSVYKCFVL